MELTSEICERARRARDARFDGRFYIGVPATGVFCRPTCPVQPGRADSVRFYPTASAASAAGLRPCLRCLPELAPGVRADTDAPRPVARALTLIEQGFLDDNNVAALAAATGVTDRHLRRLFERDVGTSPQRVAHTRRLLFAKQLLDHSGLSFTEIAFAAGFGSVRRFNSAVKATWGRSPGALRQRPEATGEPLRLQLAYRPPLDWPALLAFYRPRTLPGVEAVSEDEYCRSVRLDGRGGWFAVRAAPDRHALVLQADLPDVRNLGTLVRCVRRMFDLDADPSAVSATLKADPMLGRLLACGQPPRLPGAWDPFETAVRAILGQQVSVSAARTLATRLVETHGDRLDSAPGNGPARLFPRPEILAVAPLEELGVIEQRARAIRELAAAVAAGRLDFEAPDLAARLRSIRGIGDWTAQYVVLRSGLDPDAFPAADLGLLRALGPATTPAELRRRAEAWRPWRGYAAICLWYGGTDSGAQ